MQGVVIVSTGVANTASVIAALARLGSWATLTHDAQAVERAELLVLPGVGSFGTGMARLEEAGLVETICARVRAGRPTLAICLGMQVLFDSSEESPGVRGLGCVPGRFERYRNIAPVPQMGWNRVTGTGAIVADGHAYFANSYRLASEPDGWAVSRAEYGGRFVAAIERERVVACQFHPELSGDFGLDLLSRWLELASSRVAS